MAHKSLGKKFEKRFEFDWQTYVPDSFCYRLKDLTTGYKGTSSNIADFICYKYPLCYVIDCKSHKGGTVSFKDFSQYDDMVEHKDVLGLVLGTVCWMYEKDIVCWVPIKTWEKIKNEGKKSFNIKMLDDPEYECFILPSKKKRTFMETSYKALTDYYEEKFI